MNAGARADSLQKNTMPEAFSRPLAMLQIDPVSLQAAALFAHRVLEHQKDAANSHPHVCALPTRCSKRIHAAAGGKHAHLWLFVLSVSVSVSLYLLSVSFSLKHFLSVSVSVSCAHAPTQCTSLAEHVGEASSNREPILAIVSAMLSVSMQLEDAAPEKEDLKPQLISERSA